MSKGAMSNGSREALLKEVRGLLLRYDSEARAFGLAVVESGVGKAQDTWVVPFSVNIQQPRAASELTDLLRHLRRDLEAKLSEPVSVLIDPDESNESNAA